MEKLKFPDGFLWGSATSAYQVEGGIENNDWSQAARQGKVPAAGRACDHYNLYESDFEIAKSLGQNAHRFSIEWARIEPEEGKFDEEAIEHYRQVIGALLERGLEPFVTLWHFTLPIWFAQKGGFENPEAPKIFARYCQHVVNELGDSVKFWVTINEPMVYATNSYWRGQWPPFGKSFFRFIKVVGNLIRSHNIGYEKIKEVSALAQIGVAKNNIYFESGHNPIYQPLSTLLAWFWNHRFLNRISQNFIGLNYYFHRRFPRNKNREVSDMGWEIFPEGIFHVLRELKKYGKPIYITENGLADSKDLKREKFIKDHLGWVWRAIQDDIDVRGYFYWSLLDNFEWAHGFEPRFGLVEIDYQTMARKIRPSAFEYAQICENNSLIF